MSKKIDLSGIADVTAATDSSTPITHANVTALEHRNAPLIKYDIEEILDFIDIVFHDTYEDSNANILFWHCPIGRGPGYPMGEELNLKILTDARRPMALYYGTSSCFSDIEGKTRNRKALFNALHVVILDDIGTKVPLDKIPKDFTPTYILESSEGNFQYGYVLDKAITDIEQADAFIQLIYESGFTDGGGKTPTKLVRLPGGINAKPGVKRDFRVKLVNMDGPRWTPDKILEALDTGVKWSEVEEDALEVSRRRAGKAAGTSVWSPVALHSPDLEGVADPVLEWLYEEDMVCQETDDWTSIRCPWASQHSETDKDLASYSPIGRGGKDYTHMRGFNCFHDHCKTNKIQEFLRWVTSNGGPEVGVVDHAAHLVSEWVYDQVADAAVKIKNVVTPLSISIAAFRNTYPHKTNTIKAKGKDLPVLNSSLWLCAPNRVTVSGQVFDPTTTARIVEDEYGLRVNLFAAPEWGVGMYEPADVKVFTDYLNYLIPDKKEYDYFLQWTAAKAQKMSFRGNAILMIAEAFGTGRTTLADMFKILLGATNVENVAFKTLVTDGEWNEWKEKPLVVVNETKDLVGTAGMYKAYETLKDIIDPRPKEDRINPKFGKQRMGMLHSSFLMFTQHSNAIALAEGDRRFYVIKNAHIPKPQTYFNMINRWMTEKDPETKKERWARNVWRWLQTLEVDVDALNANAPITESKIAMIESAKSPLTVAVSAALKALPGIFVTSGIVKDALATVSLRINADTMKNYDAQLSREFTRLTATTCILKPVKIAGRASRIRVSKEWAYNKKYLSMSEQDIKADAQRYLSIIDFKKIAEDINESLDIAEL